MPWVRLAVCAFALGVFACTPKAPPHWQQVSGQAQLPENATLPEAAQLVVWLERQAAANEAPSRVAELRQQARQPLTFLLQNLQLPSEDHAQYQLRARIESQAGKLLWHTPDAALLPQTNNPVTLVMQPAAAAAPTTVFFMCDGEGLRVSLSGDQATLSLGEHTYLLTRIPSGSGAHYQSEAADFWSKGDEAILTLAGEDQRHCTAEPLVHPWAEAA
ncbi:MliC family protein [Simiduia sp. 21SJ11W-1]|uniref:MliC family protein n=1 Tax=Simiduia sp. 21SJ11W-1 TaxID=2909669 RepID=UPI00209F4235|nr:MliC family protein [Simiduia sp. 21SJ11W-1]UTA48617.1 MliC family protein [Simiduia sp. 21SJ11W-1]